jgi:hypothetical protein
MSPPRSIWWLVSGTLLVAAFAPTSLPLAGLTYAGLQLVGGPRTGAGRAGALLVGVLAFGALVVPRESATDGVVRVFQLFTALGFVSAAWAAPGPFLRRATGATAWGGVGAVALTWLLSGANTPGLLAWDTVRQASFALRAVIAGTEPEAMARMYALYEPFVRFLSAARPALEILAGYAALAAAWQWHVRTSRTPLGTALSPFREFRIADGGVWGVVAATAVWVMTARVPGLRIAALNAELVLGTLYLLRGAAVVGTVAAVAAIPPWLQAMAVVSGVLLAALTPPSLLVLGVSLCLLGVSDTWLEFRRRLEGRPN